MHKVRAGILKEVAAVYGDELEGFDAIHHDWNGPLDVRKVEQSGGI